MADPVDQFEGVVCVPVGRGKHTLIDANDLHFIEDRRLHLQSMGYVVSCRRSDFKLLHRVIMGAQRGQYVDHVNSDPLDNRRVNLRLCTNGQNQANTRRYSNATTLFRGVTYYKPTKKWKAGIGCDRVSYNLGYYETQAEAAVAYNVAALRRHREYATLNWIGPVIPSPEPPTTWEQLAAFY